MTCSKIICLNCENKRENYEPFTSLALEVSTSLLKSLEKYIEREIIKEQYCCYVCNKVSDIEKQYSIIKMPNVLIIQFKRFVSVPFSRKINMHCNFEFNLEILNFNQEKSRYDLKAIAVHSGT